MQSFEWRCVDILYNFIFLRVQLLCVFCLISSDDSFLSSSFSLFFSLFLSFFSFIISTYISLFSFPTQDLRGGQQQPNTQLTLTNPTGVGGFGSPAAVGGFGAPAVGDFGAPAAGAGGFGGASASGGNMFGGGGFGGFGAQAASTSAPRCSAGHAMVVSDFAEGPYSGGYNCDLCCGSNSDNPERWFCKKCQADVCFRCKPRTVQVTPSPPSSPEEKLHDAIVENDLVSVTALLDGGANVSDFKNVLSPACQWDRVEMLQLFDARGADLLNAVNGGGVRGTLLHTCSGYGSEKCANFLLSKGIDHKKKTSKGTSSLDYCRMNGQFIPDKRGKKNKKTKAREPSPRRKEIEKLILSKMTPEEKKKDDEKKKQGSGGFSFGGAAQPAVGGFGAPAVGGFGAPAAGAGGFGGASASSSNMFGGGGWGAPSPPSPPSPEEKIYDAIVENDLVSVTALLDGGANVNDFDHVLRPACEWDRVEMLQLFDARGADLLNAVGGFGGRNTLLHICSMYGAVKCANFLLSKGIDHKKKSSDGFGDKSSLDYCRINGQLKPAKRGVSGGNTQASEPSPERKEIEKLILSKMSPEEKKEDDSGGFSFGGAAQPAAGGFGAPAVGGFGAPAAGAGGFGGAPASSSNMFGGGFGGGFGAPAKPPSPPSPEEKIYDAIVENDLVSVTALLDGGANVSDWKNVLQPACEWDRVEMLQLFDARGADLLNAVGRLKKKFNDFGSSGVGGSTLLHICSLYGAVKCANFLLSKGIDHKKRKGGFGNTSLDCCRKNGQNIPAKRGVMSGITEASEPSPERKEIEKLILSKMKSEKELFELAANQGDADAQYDLGCLYANGQGVEQSNEKAREWMIKAAEQGHEKAIKGLQAIDKYEGKTTPSQKT